MTEFTARQAEIITAAINDSVTYSQRDKRQLTKAVREGTVNPLWIAWLFSYTPHPDFSDEPVIYNEIPGATRDEVVEIAALLS